MPWKHEAVLKRKDVFEIDPRQVEIENGWNPRTDFGGHEDLKRSIIENGVIEPVTVKVVDNRIILIDGERRIRATLAAIGEGHDIKSVPAILARRGISDIEAMIVAVVKNDGKPLTPTEEAEAYRKLISWGLTQSDIAKRIGRSQAHVSQRLQFVDAAPELKTAIDKKQIKQKAARQIIKKSKGDISEQRKGLERSKQGESEGNGFKPMRSDKIEKLLSEYRHTDRGPMNEYAKAFNEGVITGLSMVLYNSPDVKKEWIA